MHRIGVTQWSLGVIGPNALLLAAHLSLATIHIDAGEAKGQPSLGIPSVQRAYLECKRNSGTAITGVALNRFNDIGVAYAPDVCWDFARRSIDAAHILDVPTVIIPWFRQNTLDTQTKIAQAESFLYRLSREALPPTMMLAIETDLGVHELCALMKAVDHARVRLLLDIYNPVIAGHHVAAMLPALANWLLDQVHVKDGHHTTKGEALLGEGNGDIRATLAALLQLDFMGDFVLENAYPFFGWQGIHHDIAVLNSFFPLAKTPLANMHRKVC